MDVKKEFVIDKKCDLKDKDFREYQFIRELEVDEEGVPINEELENIISLEDKNKMVAFFIGNTFITMFSYKNIRKFKNKVVDEYCISYNEGIYNKFYLASDEKTAAYISEEIEYIKSQSAKIVSSIVNERIRK